jgi:membrane-bound lytic murein transglycosylase B
LTFSARFRAELASRRFSVLTALLITVAAAGSALADLSLTSPSVEMVAADDRTARTRRISFTAAPGDTHTWRANARLAAERCPGLPAEVLVAIAQVETRMGADLTPSSEGAVGPMQFLPSTWAAYGTDGDSDGQTDIMSPIDAMHGAVRLLCANGGADPEQLPSALWNYNHSPAYVERVLELAGLSA